MLLHEKLCLVSSERGKMNTTDDLHAFLQPASVAVIGAPNVPVHGVLHDGESFLLEVPRQDLSGQSPGRDRL